MLTECPDFVFNGEKFYGLFYTIFWLNLIGHFDVKLSIGSGDDKALDLITLVYPTVLG